MLLEWSSPSFYGSTKSDPSAKNRMQQLLHSDYKAGRASLGPWRARRASSSVARQLCEPVTPLLTAVGQPTPREGWLEDHYLDSKARPRTISFFTPAASQRLSIGPSPVLRRRRVCSSAARPSFSSCNAWSHWQQGKRGTQSCQLWFACLPIFKVLPRSLLEGFNRKDLSTTFCCMCHFIFLLGLLIDTFK